MYSAHRYRLRFRNERLFENKALSIRSTALQGNSHQLLVSLSFGHVGVKPCLVGTRTEKTLRESASNTGCIKQHCSIQFVATIIGGFSCSSVSGVASDIFMGAFLKFPSLPVLRGTPQVLSVASIVYSVSKEIIISQLASMLHACSRKALAKRTACKTNGVQNERRAKRTACKAYTQPELHINGTFRFEA